MQARDEDHGGVLAENGTVQGALYRPLLNTSRWSPTWKRREPWRWEMVCHEELLLLSSLVCLIMTWRPEQFWSRMVIQLKTVCGGNPTMKLGRGHGG
ncbi:hypothetical protein ACLOJK_030506 [Asimina triloba]